MHGRYLRRKQDGPRNPTMTHVDDPSIYKVGDYEGWHVITRIDEDVFPNTRFAHMGLTGATMDHMLGEPGYYDFRPLDAENHWYNGIMVNGRPVREVMTLEQARQSYEDALAKHMNGFVP